MALTGDTKKYKQAVKKKADEKANAEAAIAQNDKKTSTAKKKK